MKPEYQQEQELDEWISRLIHEVEERGMIEPPAGMKEQIMERARGHKQEVARETSSLLQLGLYSFKVALTGAAAIFFLFSINTAQLTKGMEWFYQEENIVTQFQEKSEKMKGLLQRAAGQYRMEVFNHDKKEK